jgi:hypothetical protein
MIFNWIEVKYPGTGGVLAWRWARLKFDKCRNVLVNKLVWLIYLYLL